VNGIDAKGHPAALYGRWSAPLKGLNFSEGP
jgi:hypothetical protein